MASEQVSKDQVVYVDGDAIEGARLAASEGRRVFLVHGCNDAGRWGAGFTAALDAVWPDVGWAFREWAETGEWNGREVPYGLGRIIGVPVESSLWVVNAVTQHGTVSPRNPVPVDYDAIGAAFGRVADAAAARDAEVFMPRIGCGLAGGSWPDVAVLLSAFTDGPVPVPVTVWTL